MSDIGPVMPIVLSSYVSTTVDPYKETKTAVEHLSTNGSIRIDSVDYIRYNRDGELVKPEKQTIDISV
jgi:diacylglycerol kinase family enzyme